MKIITWPRRLSARTAASLLAATGLIGGAAVIAPNLASHPKVHIHQVDAATTDNGTVNAAGLTADTAGSNSSQPAPVKLTCSDFNGAGFLNWDILVQLSPDGTAQSAAPIGDAYLTGVQLFSVERTDPPVITVGDGGRSLHFEGSALLQATIPGTSFSVSGGTQYCDADFSFPNPQSPVINPEPSS